jgi:hypothetical protein
MPGSVQVAAPTYVLPLSLSRAFTEVREYGVLGNSYPDGSSQRSLETTTSRKRFAIGKRVTVTEVATLRAFYEARKGPHQPFYFYNPRETDPPFTQNPSGTTGRYTVRFDCAWEQSSGPSRSEVSIQLIEIV